MKPELCQSWPPSLAYPGRYTTFIVTPLAVVTCVMIILINSESPQSTYHELFLSALLVPLSAYETRQEFTYTPNSTRNVLPFSNLVPAPLRKHSVQFTPHTFVMGDSFQTDLGAFRYNITSAYSRNDTRHTPGSSKPSATDGLPSFSYMNSDLSSCDVLYIKIMFRASTSWSPAPQVGVSVSDFIIIMMMLTISPESFPQALISCWFPVFFQFELSSINYLPSVIQEASPNMTNVISATLVDYVHWVCVAKASCQWPNCSILLGIPAE